MIEMNINATLLNYYLICHRKLWLHAHVIRMEHTSDVVYEGKLIGEMSYPQRAERYTEVEISGTFPKNEMIRLSAKIDFYDPHQGIVHEIKKSDAKEQAHVRQVQFYLYLLRQNGIGARSGVLEYPRLRQTEVVTLEAGDTSQLEKQIMEVSEVIAGSCPPLLTKSKCRSCSYFDFCWTEE